MNLSQQGSQASERPHRLERSPHPYSRRQAESQFGYPASGEAEAREQDAVSGTGQFTPAQHSGGSSDNETEIDTVRRSRLLPAPQPYLRKGLRISNGEETFNGDSPFLSPSQLHEDSKSSQKSYFEAHGAQTQAEESQHDARRTRDKFVRRRKAELLRRLSEAVALALLCSVVLSENGTRVTATYFSTGLRTHVAIVAALFLLYPLRLLWPRLHHGHLRFGRMRVPSVFDPAILLYPPVVPAVVALSVSSAWRGSVLPNLVLGLSTLPSQLIPSVAAPSGLDPIHWILTLMPIMTHEHDIATMTLTNNAATLDVETLTLLFPLHQALLPPLHFLTTSSLLPTELQLLTVALINVFLLSSTPQALILRSLLSIGGLSLFLLCSKSIRNNVALERIPAWRSQQGTQGYNARRDNRALSFGDRPLINGQASSTFSCSAKLKETQRNVKSIPELYPYSSADQWRSRNSDFLTSDPSMNGAPPGFPALDDENMDLRRVQTVPINYLANRQPSESIQGHLRTTASNATSYTPMSARQINTRKISYTIYTYIAIVLVILLPVRISIGQALHDWEPIGWAIGYLFGDVPGVSHLLQHWDLQSWVPLRGAVVPRDVVLPIGSLGWVDSYRHALGDSNVRLAVFAYWALVIAMGLFTVLRVLPEFAEVDTRRKVFHGMMVVMLLPSTFIDPCFLALGLTMVLAVFLLLEVIRAGQLRPLSQPLARFITPYVDGRDRRGPIVVSHIFLLIGCAIPLWLSLAAVERQTSPYPRNPVDGITSKGNPWLGWELAKGSNGSRDLSMVAGVICVGMGDSAASLIGRRYGRRKWPWAGGKSLEGSAAFAVAVTAGIMFAKAWLLLGGWQVRGTARNFWSSTMAKAVVAASGASFTEAVLTGANDNVVVPIVLWLLVRGLDI